MMESGNGDLELRNPRHDRVTPIRRSLRLPGYDYSQVGAYFVTIVTQGRECLFGDVVGAEMRANVLGEMVETVWRDLPARYPGIDIDWHIVMPNHFHGIVVLTHAQNIVGAPPRGCPLERVPDGGRARGPAPTMGLPDAIHRFKSLTTNRFLRGVADGKWASSSGRLWQRNYYDHIIRDENDLRRAREYIEMNPARWADDEEYRGPCA